VAVDVGVVVAPVDAVAPAAAVLAAVAVAVAIPPAAASVDSDAPPTAFESDDAASDPHPAYTPAAASTNVVSDYTPGSPSIHNLTSTVW